MFDDSNIIAGLEIGTTKICAVIGEPKVNGSLNIIGIGQAISRGVRKGEIINPQEVEEDVREAVAEAEQMANVEIRSVYLGITGSHLRGFQNRGFHQVVSAGHEISGEDVEAVLQNAQAVNLPAENTLIHTIRQHFLVDDEGGVTDPVGLHGAQLTVDLHVIHGKTNRLQNGIRLVRATSLEVDDIVFTGLASSLALLTSEQKELGALVIDIGGGTTDYIVYSEGIIRHSGILTVGGDHLTNDLAYGLKISLHRAEKLKREHGSAIVGEQAGEETVSVTDERGMEIKRVNAGQVQIITSMRQEEIFKIIADDLAEAGLKEFLRAGVMLCGGGSRLSGILTLAEKTFHLPVAIGRANGISGLASTLNEPEFTTAIGLVKYGALRERKSSTRLSWWSSVMGFIKMLVALLR